VNHFTPLALQNPPEYAYCRVVAIKYSRGSDDSKGQLVTRHAFRTTPLDMKPTEDVEMWNIGINMFEDNNSGHNSRTQA
jgi:hypothetical protein